MPKLNRANNASNLVDKELTHVPQVDISEQGNGVKVDVKCGQNPHAMEMVHFIEYIEIFDDETFLARQDMSFDNQPAATFFLQKRPEKLVARARCNTHGEWIHE